MRVIVRAGLLFANIICASIVGSAQIAPTGPAALARQIPTVYGPYLANISRVRIAEKRSGTLHLPGSVVNGNRRTNQPGGSQPSTSPGTGGTPLSATTTTFTPVQTPFVPRKLSEVLGKNTDEQKSIQAVLTKCLNYYNDTARRKGVPLNDVALALNYYISTNYFVYSNGGGPTQSQMSATRDQIRLNLAQDENFRQMSDRDKQEAYETLIVLAGFVDLGYGTTKQSSNGDAAEQFRDMAKHNLEALLGVSVSKIHYTDVGLTLDQ
jgi:hypothetical protein